MARAPYNARWDTWWIPDQPLGKLRLIARIQDCRGLWSITEPVEELGLRREEVEVKLFPARDVPTHFGVRVGQTKSCMIELPPPLRLQAAREAVLALRTWHGWDGHHSPLKLNGQALPIQGKNHHYDFDLLPLPLTALEAGINRFTIHSNTEHHMLEVLWPGPAILGRFAREAASE